MLATISYNFIPQISGAFSFPPLSKLNMQTEKDPQLDFFFQLIHSSINPFIHPQSPMLDSSYLATPYLSKGSSIPLHLLIWRLVKIKPDVRWRFGGTVGCAN